ncbi:MAG: transketolase [Deltaproteobacteria bacterium]|nr:transketolase [Deltaproteobacteria bacterium]
MSDQENLDLTCIQTIRFLAVDAIEKAKSGHPGMPLGAAAAAYVLWARHLKHNPANPQWIDRDRFVLSAGHASMLLYALLHLSGYDLALSDLQSFRQWNSRTPGHPERNHPRGSEMTTGPLGQGFGAAVGMAMAEAHLAALYNREGYPIVDHHTYVLASDGDLMEGVSFEASALAGHLGLGKLIVLYDDNRVSLAGSTQLSFSEDVAGRFESCGWQALHVPEGNDLAAIDRAIGEAKADGDRPSIICIRTTIGCGAPRKEGSFEAHGAPLGAEETRAAKERVGWPLEPAFFVPEDVNARFREFRNQGKRAEESWKEIFRRYRDVWPGPAGEYERITAGELPLDWENALPDFSGQRGEMATRKASEAILKALAPVMPELMGGSADLNPSTFTWIKGAGDFQRPAEPDPCIQGATGGAWGRAGRNIHFGVREHAMGAIASGLALHGGIIPFTGTFFTFSDYMRPPMRLAALMGLRVIYVFSHDGIGVGEDGPTHQPIEQLMNLRAVPNLVVIRPADAAETAEAWRAALLRSEGPTALILTRQNVPHLDRTVLSPAGQLKRGGYILWDSSPQKPQVILIGTGSEVSLALEAAQILAGEGLRVRVVSLPSWELFDGETQEYRNHVLPPDAKHRIAVEAGIRLGWEHYVGIEGAVVGMDGFGASAPLKVLYDRFGITAAQVAAVARRLTERR